MKTAVRSQKHAVYIKEIAIGDIEKKFRIF
jgi:hypothetical protein